MCANYNTLRGGLPKARSTPYQDKSSLNKSLQQKLKETDKELEVETDHERKSRLLRVQQNLQRTIDKERETREKFKRSSAVVSHRVVNKSKGVDKTKKTNIK